MLSLPSPKPTTLPRSPNLEKVPARPAKVEPVASEIHPSRPCRPRGVFSCPSLTSSPTSWLSPNGLLEAGPIMVSLSIPGKSGASSSD